MKTINPSFVDPDKMFGENVNPATDPNKPLPETSVLFAHNAYNAMASGGESHQELSITEILDLGVRGLELDVYLDNGELKLCHLFEDYGVGSNLKLEDALREIKAWRESHPGEVVFLDINDHLDDASKKLVTDMIADVLGHEAAFTPDDLEKNFDNQWPSLRDISAYGRNIVVLSVFQAALVGQFKQSSLSGIITRTRDLASKITHPAVRNYFLRELQELQADPYLFIPAAMVAGAAIARLERGVNEEEGRNKFLKSITLAMDAGINLALLRDGKIIFKATTRGQAAYDRYIDGVLGDRSLSPQDRVRAIAAAVPPTIGGGFEVVIPHLAAPVGKIQLSSATSNYLKSMVGAHATSFTQMCYNLGARFLVGRVIATPAVEAVKGAVDVSSGKPLMQRIEDGFLKGIENSFFGLLFKADVPMPNPLEIAARRWQNTLDMIPNMSKAEQREVYDRKVEQGIKNALDHGVRKEDMLPYPSFEEVDAYLFMQRAYPRVQEEGMERLEGERVRKDLKRNDYRVVLEESPKSREQLRKKHPTAKEQQQGFQRE